MRYSVERAYFDLAEACDAVAAEERELFLAKLALLLAEHAADLDVLARAIRVAQADLRPA